MDKSTFLRRLDERLRFLAEAERKDILYDYEEHILAALENGEKEEDIISKLGSPELIARQYTVSKVIKNAETNHTSGNILRAVVASLGLGFFNLIFVVGPFFGLLGVLIGIYAVAFGFAVSGLALGGVGIFGLLGGDLGQMIHLGKAVSYNADVFSVGLLGLGIFFGASGGLVGIGSAWLTKWFYKGTLEYLKLNLRLIKGENVTSNR